MKYVHRIQDVPPASINPKGWLSKEHFAKEGSLGKFTERVIVHPHTDAGIKNVSICYDELLVGGSTSPHLHKDIEQLFYVLDGEAILNIGGEKHRITSDTLVTIPLNTLHNLQQIGNKTFKYLDICAPPLPDDTLKELGVLKD